MKSLFVSACLLAGSALPVWSHEFWIDPIAYSIDTGSPIEANLRVGQNFAGSVYAYIPKNFHRFELYQGDMSVPVTGRAGDRPALNMPAPADGLATIVHLTTDLLVTYSEREKFEDFVTHKDFAWVLEEHANRGLPETGFRERYSRHAKSLIDVGSGQGADQVVGLETEIVALANPYTDDMSAGLPVLVLYQGQPRADVQVELFEKSPSDHVTIAQYRTDAQGRAVLPVKAGHRYLVDSVVMRAVDPAGEDGAVWESLWASLTFAVAE